MATIREVAARAGVSTTTVSYALNHPDRVTEELRARVEEAVRDLDYRPNGTARALRTRRSQVVALIVPDMANHFYARLARGVHDVVKPHGFHVTVGSTDADEADERYFLREVAAQRVAGVIVVPFRLSSGAVRRACGQDLQVVAVAPVEGDASVPTLSFDDEGGAEQAVAHLLGRGRRRIAFVGGLTDTPPSRRRYAGYRRAHERAGMPIDPRLQLYADFQREGGEQATMRLLDGGIAFDAIFAANDLMAIGAMRALQRRQIRIPRDVAVVGLDDIDEAEIVEPALTTVRQPAYEAGRCAAEMLIARIDGRPETAAHIVLPTTLIVRESS